MPPTKYRISAASSAPFVDEEERGDRTDVKRDHRRSGDPVHALLILAPVHERRLHHRIRPPVVCYREKSVSTIASRAAADCNTCVLSLSHLVSRG